MFEWIKENTRTKEGIDNLSKQDIYYAWKWYEEGSLKINDEVIDKLADQMCLLGM